MPRWVKAVMLVGILELPFLLWLWLAPLMEPQRFTNHQDQVTAVLRQNGVAVTQVYLNQGWPDRINHQTYGANLTLYLVDNPAQPVLGRIECRTQKRKCWFQVAKLGIGRIELTDLVPPAATPQAKPEWQTRVKKFLAQLGIPL